MPRGVKKTTQTGTMRQFLSPKAEVKKELGEKKQSTKSTVVKEEQKPGLDNVKLEQQDQSNQEKGDEEVNDSKENVIKKKVKRQRKKTSESDSDVEKEPKKKAKKTAEKTKRSAAKKLKDEEGDEELRDVAGEVLATVGKSNKRLGFHVSAAGGAENAIENAVSTGCRAFALFIRNQRTWNHKPMEETRVVAWKAAMEKHKFDIDQILPHGSYLCNPGTPDAEKLAKTRDAMLDECQRCEKLGIKLYNFHPGSTTGACTVEECIKTVSDTINYIIEKTSFITLVIETMAGQGHTVGGKFEEIRSMIDKVNNKTRVGVCIDTCHIFAAGYDIRTKKAYEKTMSEFNEIIGLKYLKACHLNDSKGDLGCKLDRHENLGKGKIGKDTFGFLVNDARLDGIPMILETPEGKYPEEMKLMYSMDELNKK